jgi:uncharacterized protein YegL
MNQVLKNHVAFVLDVSGSMTYISDSVRSVFQKQIEFLRKTSQLFEQETRVSIYTFNNSVNCLISDTDVMRPLEIDRLSCFGSTALLDATKLSLEDLKLLPQKYGDHSFIIYVLTDGEENSSNTDVRSFKSFISNLPDNFTVCALAPNNNSMRLLEGYGIPKGNIEKWDATSKGVEEVGEKLEKTLTNYYTARSTGTRSFSTVFSDLNKVSVDQVKTVAKEVNNFQVVINEDVKAIEIRPLVEDKLKTKYVMGKAYYELVKRETVQDGKAIAVQDKKTGKVYEGFEARKLLNLPDYGEVKIDPILSPKWNVYIQSTSVNRKVIPKQRVLVLK